MHEVVKEVFSEDFFEPDDVYEALKNVFFLIGFDLRLLLKFSNKPYLLILLTLPLPIKL
jgi:hypothetical protein